MPKISIITASFNSAETLEHCIVSVAAQKIDAEHIIVDGFSRDATLEIIDRHHDKLASVISESDRGIYDAMNKGIKHASGDVVGFLNADDFYPAPDVLATVLQALDEPAFDACYGDLVYVQSDDLTSVKRYWKSGSYQPNRFYHGWMPPHPTFFARRSVYEKFGLFNLDLGSAADYEIMLRFLLKEKVAARYIPRVLVHMRTGGVSNASLTNRWRANRFDRQAWRVNGLRPYPWTLAAKPLRKIGQWVTKPK